METKKLFEKYRARLIREGILKSFLIGLIVAFAIAALIAFITSASYFTKVFKLWYLVALGVGAVVGVIVAVTVYFLKFRPTAKKIARRVDKLGLEERVITMLELEKDESYIAMRQREDAKAKIKEVNSKSIRFVVSKSLITAAVVVGVFGMLMTTVNALAAHDIIDPPPILEQQKEIVTVEYKVLNETGGRIEGDTLFKIEKGSDTTTPVCAVADDGYEFAYWMDEIGNPLDEYPERKETSVNKNMVIYAVFEQLSITDIGDPTQGYDPYAYPKPDEIGDKPEPPDDISTPDNPDTEWSPNNQIKDNNTSYYPEYEVERDDAMNQLENDPTLSGKHKEAIGSYYDQLNPPEEKTNP